MQSAKQAHKVWCNDSEWVSGDPSRPGAWGEIFYILQVLSHSLGPTWAYIKALYSRARVHVERWGSPLEASEEGPHYLGLDLECPILLQPCPHFSHVWSEYGQGEVGIWARREDGHGHGLDHFWSNLTDGPAQLLSARISYTDHNLVHRQRSGP